jgi:outer membrane protein assembly factor BamC
MCREAASVIALRLRAVLASLSAAILLAACGSMPKLESDKIEYKAQAKKLPQLEIPPDLTRPTSDDRYAVPDINPKGQATYSDYSKERAVLAPDASKAAVLPSLENARIERSGSQRWLVVKGEPDAVWNIVKEFWQETGFLINTENPDAGVMETDWNENRAKVDAGMIRNFLGKILDSVYSTAERDKFRTRLERGTEPGTTEVYISHRGMEEVYTSSSADNTQTKWQPRPPDPDLEAEMLRRLMTRFGVGQERAKVEMAAAQAPARATLLKGRDGSGTLSVNDQFDRAWRRVGLALDRVGFTVEDRDRSKGLYFVRYVDPDADSKSGQSKGFFAKLNPFNKSDKKTPSEQYRIQVKDGDSVSQVSVLGKDGNQEKSETAARILSLLYEQLK